MKRNISVFIMFVCSYLLSQAAFSQEIIKGNETIWQKKPGNINLNWESQVFHLGNGYFGASSYGGAKQEILTLSEKTFWTGGPGDQTGYNFGIVPENDLSYIGEIKKVNL